jgi:hypothetical protein
VTDAAVPTRRRPWGRVAAAVLVAGLCVLSAACATPPPESVPLPWRIEPVYRVTDSRFADAAAYRALARQYELEGRYDEAQQARRRAARLLESRPGAQRNTSRPEPPRTSPP